MKVDQINQFDINYIERVDIKSLIMPVFYQLDNFFKFISKSRKEILSPYLSKIKEDFDKVIKNESSQNDIWNDFEKEFKLDLLQDYPDLLKKICTIITISFNLENYTIHPEKNKMRIKAFDRYRGRKIPLYLCLISLTKILPREEAIDLYKDFLEEGVKYYQDKPPSMESVDGMLKLYKRSFPKTHVYSLFKIQEGKVGCKISRCMIYEALKDFDPSFDEEIGFLTSCYNDYVHARSVNKNFILNRTKTIMENNDVCDFCWHDTLIIDEVKHPSEDFWKSFK